MSAPIYHNSAYSQPGYHGTFAAPPPATHVPMPSVTYQSTNYIHPVNPTYHTNSDADAQSAVIIFILGMCCFFIWVLNFKYLKSPNSIARAIAMVSAIFFGFCILGVGFYALFILLLIFTGGM
ncbi:hypothetical protein RCL1_006146 [Eukaryota sp. TZLM3-RCL]